MLESSPIVNLIKYTWRYSQGNRPMVVFFVFLSLLGNSVQLLDPYFVSKAFDAVQFSPNDPALLKHVIFYLSLLIVTNLVFWSLHGTSRIIEQRNAFFVRKKYKLAMFEKILQLPTAWHKDHHSGDTIDKVNKSSESLFEFSRLMFIITTNIVRLLGGVIALSIFFPQASLIAVVIAISTYSIIFAFDKKIRIGYKIAFKSENHLAAAIHDYISNIITIITLRLRGRVTKEIERRSMLSYSAYRKNISLAETKWFFASFLLSLMISSVLIFDAYHSYKTAGVIVVGTLFALYLYLRRIGDTFFDFAQRYGDMVRQDAALRAAAVIDDEFAKVVHTENATLSSNWQKIEVKKLSFTYPSEDNPEHKRVHLKNINITIKRGQRIALIGESGSGKSTLLALLRGLYLPISGTAYSDGKKLPLGLAHLYDHVTLIPQDPEIFNSTIEDNITMETKVEEKELTDAINLAQFSSVIDRLPNGLQTNVLEKGVSLSGGEKQRLALARGILAARNSDFLFMDEPTSSVDTQNELLIYTGIFEAFKDKTIISSIHRLHLLRLFDQIYYFKQGQLEAFGTLDEIQTHPDVKALLDKYHVIRN